MKKTIISCVAVCILLNFNAFSQVDPSIRQAREILEHVFELGEIQELPQGDYALVAPLRGQHGAIPLNQCELIEFDDGIVGMAFEIFLSAGKHDYKNTLEKLMLLQFPDNYMAHAKINPGKSRLIQFIYYDTRKQQFIGKPEGFPISRDDFWFSEGYGDAGSDYFDISLLEKIPGSKYACVMAYEVYQSDVSVEKYFYAMNLLGPRDEKQVLVSDKLAPEQGQKSVNYTNFEASGNSISVSKQEITYVPETYDPWGENEVASENTMEIKIMTW